jgi:hypothetical protein
MLIQTFFFQESRVHPNDSALPLKDCSELMTGRVKWCFRLQWSPGGEEWILPNHDKDLLEHPWWKPPSPESIPPLKKNPSLDTQSIDNLISNPATPGVSQEIPARTPPQVASTFESQATGDKYLTAPFKPESTFDTTPRYRVAGGEEWIMPNHDQDLLEHPPQSIPPLEEILSSDTQSLDKLIFNPAAPGVSQEVPARTPPQVASTFDSQATGDKDLTAPFEPESTFDTTSRYRVARLSNVNYEFRHAHFRELYHSLVPLQLLAPYGRTVLDSSFPRGWLCETCGKMNFQAALRHRACSSSLCKVRLVFLANS